MIEMLPGLAHMPLSSMVCKTVTSMAQMLLNIVLGSDKSTTDAAGKSSKYAEAIECSRWVVAECLTCQTERSWLMLGLVNAHVLFNDTPFNDSKNKYHSDIVNEVC